MVNHFGKEKKPSNIASKLISKNDIGRTKGNFKVSLQYLDSSQKYGSGFKDWQSHGLLSKAMEVLQGYCCRPLLEQIDGDKFTIYGNFPVKSHTFFERPNNISEDANWARIHITGVTILAGHIVEDTFYIVFLDKGHKFYLTKRTRKKKDQ